MEAAFNDWADQFIGTCDFSFAIPKFAQGTNQQQEETSAYMVDDDTFYSSVGYYDEDSLTSTSSCRSVTFSDNVECHTVARYIDQENRRDLFYSGADVQRFKQEFKMERMHSQPVARSRCSLMEKSVYLKKAILANKALTKMQYTSSNGESATPSRHSAQVNVHGMFV
mmetsp:Transcript_6948/g.10144  ORF Transcript_6948/g.10144 Transcript_6948/m.10144 type:complete len:168 (+) Transcript_6948:203-706(+)